MGPCDCAEARTSLFIPPATRRWRKSLGMNLLIEILNRSPRPSCASPGNLTADQSKHWKAPALTTMHSEAGDMTGRRGTPIEFTGDRFVFVGAAHSLLALSWILIFDGSVI